MPVGDPTVLGTLGTGNILASRLPVDIGDRIHLLDKDNNPLVVFVKKAPKKVAPQPKFGWVESRFEPTAITLDTTAIAALGSAGTQFVLPTGEAAYVQKGDVIMVPGTAGASPNQYDELMLVTAYTSASRTVTVIRNFGARNAAADISTLTADVTCYILGTVFEEGSASAGSRSVKQVEHYNYTEIFKDAYEVTGTDQSSDLLLGKDREIERAKKSLKHMRDIERAFIGGQPKVDTTTGTHPIRQTGGLLYWIQSNVIPVNGPINYPTLLLYLKQIFRYGDNKQRLTLCGGTAMAAIMLMIENKLLTAQTEQMYGVKVMKVVSGFGDLMLVHHKALDDMNMSGHMIIVDTDGCRYRFLAGRDTKFEANIETPGTDVSKDQWLTECGLEFALEEHSAVIEGITGFSAA